MKYTQNLSTSHQFTANSLIQTTIVSYLGSRRRFFTALAAPPFPSSVHSPHSSQNEPAGMQGNPQHSSAHSVQWLPASLTVKSQGPQIGLEEPLRSGLSQLLLRTHVLTFSLWARLSCSSSPYQTGYQLRALASCSPFLNMHP